MRPCTRFSSCKSCCSCTAAAFGLTLAGCCARTGETAISTKRKIAAPKKVPSRARSLVIFRSSLFARSDLDRFVIGRLPAPGTGAVAAFHHAFLVNLRDDFAVAGEQGLRRAHLGAKRQLALRKTVGAVFRVFGGGVVGFRPARAEGAFVHLAARAEIADARILRRAERTGVEAVTAADADVLRVQHDAIGGGVEGI